MCWMVVVSMNTTLWARAKYCSIFSPTRSSRSSRSIRCWAAAKPAAASTSAETTAARLRLHVSLVCIQCRIGDSGFDERVVPLPAFAAGAAMLRQRRRTDTGLGSAARALRIHARQRELEGHTGARTAADDVGLRQVGIGRVDPDRVRQSERQRL